MALLSNKKSKLCIALTPGEPAGIGPDVFIQLSKQSFNANLVVFADPVMLQDRARLLGIPMLFEILEYARFKNSIDAKNNLAPITVVPVKTRISVGPGELNRFNAEYVLETIKQAANACLDGYCHALVTGPVHKGVINDAGISFSGHTEYLAQLTGCAQPVMMLQADKFRVALVTTHLPINRVSEAITRDRLTLILETLHHDLVKRFKIKNPAIYVAGLNPHAGEGGHLGDEEFKVIIPVLEQLRSKNINIHGPYSADTMFVEYEKHADVFLAMFHDQGLPLLKYKGFHSAVNITLGLPIIRTSVDHGTALNLAGTGKSDPGSLAAALNTAVEMAANE